MTMGGSAHTPNLLFGKDPGNLRDARNSLSPVVNHCVLNECTINCALVELVQSVSGSVYMYFIAKRGV